MFKIDQLEHEALARASRLSFESRVLEHLRCFFGSDCIRLGEESCRGFIREGMRTAAFYGIVSERGVCFYVDLMILFGADFDRNPRSAWARAVLTDGGIKTEEQKLDMLRAEAIAHEKNAIKAPDRNAK